MPTRRKIGAGILLTLPAPPSDLGATGRETWNTCGRFLVAREALGAGDLPGLAMYARLIERARHLEARIVADGLVQENGKPSPLIGPANVTAAAAKAWAQALGLAANSRRDMPKGEESTEAPPSAVMTALTPRRRRAA
jgi:phage terminase small subunit